MEVIEYYSSYYIGIEREITQNSLNVCDLIGRMIQTHRF